MINISFFSAHKHDSTRFFVYVSHVTKASRTNLFHLLLLGSYCVVRWPFQIPIACGWVRWVAYLTGSSTSHDLLALIGPWLGPGFAAP